MSQKKWPWKYNGTLRDYSKLETAKDKMLLADPNLERNMSFHQDVEKMLFLYSKLDDEMKKASTI